MIQLRAQKGAYKLGPYHSHVVWHVLKHEVLWIHQLRLLQVGRHKDDVAVVNSVPQGDGDLQGGQVRRACLHAC